MGLSELFDSNAFFRSEADIRLCIKNSKNYKGEEPSTARLLTIFSTSKQRTYLVATSERLYCILDDARKDAPHINWSIAKGEILSNGRMLIDIRTRDKTDKTGIVDIGQKHEGWLFTKGLFLKKDLKASVEELIIGAMNVPANRF